MFRWILFVVYKDGANDSISVLMFVLLKVIKNGLFVTFLENAFEHMMKFGEKCSAENKFQSKLIWMIKAFHQPIHTLF